MTKDDEFRQWIKQELEKGGWRPQMIVAWILQILTDNHKLEQRNQGLEEELAVEGVRAFVKFEEEIEAPLRGEIEKLKKEKKEFKEHWEAAVKKTEEQAGQIEELRASKQDLLRRIESLLNVVPELIGQIARLLGEKGLQEMPSLLDVLMTSESQDVRSLAYRGWNMLFAHGKKQPKPYQS